MEKKKQFLKAVWLFWGKDRASGLEEQSVFIYFVFQNLGKNHLFDMQLEQQVKEGNLRLPNWSPIDLCQHLKAPSPPTPQS